VIGQGRIVAQGTKAELLEAAGTLVRTPRVHDLAGALTVSGLAFTPSTAAGSTDALRVEADPALVGQVAQQAGIALIELRAAEGAGLEEMFLELTADTQREGAAA
jgi:ABC-2 type transport system ATP-binding protein